ncbi:MAG TPA: hypothetical protein PK743_12860 [Luteimonas sp.]|nr:hypothetical protein [Luteimonas sp.]HRO26950.1 hypothetical protein [Luteimonas sp.]HRP73507.1 hypothetical protein [Luteimonas sp.]
MVLLLVAVLGHAPLLLQHAGALGVALFGHALLAVTVAMEAIDALALGADARFLATAVEALRVFAAVVAAVVAAIMIRLAAGRGTGDLAARRLGLPALLATAAVLARLGDGLRLPPLRLATAVATGLLAALRLLALALFAVRTLALLVTQGGLLALRLFALGLFTLPLLTLHRLLATLVLVALLAGGALAFDRTIALLGSRLALGVFTLARLLATLALVALLADGALAFDRAIAPLGLCLSLWCVGARAFGPPLRARSGPVRGLAARPVFAAVRFLSLLAAGFAPVAPVAASVLRERGDRHDQGQAERHALEEDAGGEDVLHGSAPCRHTGRCRHSIWLVAMNAI